MTKHRAGSLVTTLLNLDVGESYSRTVMVGLGDGLGDKSKEAKTKMKNHLNSHAARANTSSGNEFRIDTGTWISHEDAVLFVTVVITRII